MEPNWDDVIEAQSLEPMVDCDRDHPVEMPFPHCSCVRDATGCEESVDGCVRL